MTVYLLMGIMLGFGVGIGATLWGLLESFIRSAVFKLSLRNKAGV